jgi:bifunctional DNA-binding transcriptional regulator/antitoxin component of YhaV-PrlF toxin-antitoxin module
VAKVTSKYQVSIPRRLAEQLSIAPGDEIDWGIAGSELRITRPGADDPVSRDERLALFDAATHRQATRNKKRPATSAKDGRGWTREDLYDRGRTR